MTLGTPLTGIRNLPISGTADMKRVTAALRQVILPYPRGCDPWSLAAASAHGTLGICSR